MIQRIQTIYLIISAAICAVLFSHPFASFNINNPDSIITATVCHTIPNTELNAKLVPLAAISTSLLLLTVIAIFMFRNRTKQMLVTRINIVLCIAQLALMIGSFSALKSSLNSDFNGLDLWIAAPVIMIVLQYLAYRGIKKDDDLVKSADRLR